MAGIRAIATPVAPSIILKRKLAEDDSQAATAVAPTKRLRFDSALDVKVIGDPAEKDQTAVKEEVRRAIRERELYGESEDYDEIKNIFEEKPGTVNSPTSSLLRKYLQALSYNASSLKGQLSDLVNAVIDTQWLAHDEAFGSVFIRFLGQLGSSHSPYIPNIFKMLVANFSHLSTSAGLASRASSAERAALTKRVHLAIKYLLQLIPSSSTALLAALPRGYPFKDDTLKADLDYAKNLLQIIDYAPELKSDILDLITERLIKLDVEVQIDIEDLEEDVGDLLGDHRPIRKYKDEWEEKEEEIEVSDEDSDDESDDFQTAAELSHARIKTLRSSTAKMDALLDLLFSYYDPQIRSTKPGTSAAIFDLLLGQFRKTILPAHHSRHTQFLLFHFAQTSSELTTRFLTTCLQIVASPIHTAYLRMSAAFYLGSFIARASHITSDDVYQVGTSLMSFIERQRLQFEPRSSGPNVKAYGPYYAAFQALIYIFCFRWRDLLSDPEDYQIGDTEEENEDELLNALQTGALQWMPNIRSVLNSNAISILNPLKVCAPTIVEEFARIAKYLSVVYVFNVLESNKRIRLSQFVRQYDGGIQAVGREGLWQLDAWFPFDPYTLPGSKRWVEGDWNEWRGVPGLDGPGGGAGEDEEDSEEDEEDDDGDSDEDGEGDEDAATETPEGSLV